MHIQRPPPGRRRLLTSIILSISALMLLGTPTRAQRTEDHLNQRDLFSEYASRGEIHIDTALLHRRADSSSSATSFSDSRTSAVASSTAAAAPSSIPTDTPAALPVPFDTFSAANFTATSCPDFFNTFLGNSTLRQCAPVSLLLQNSASFITAQRSPSTLRYLLDTACGAPISICAATLTDIARQLTSDAHCGADFRARQPLVIQAYNGLVSYEPVATATCLTTPSDAYNETSAPVSPSTSGEDDTKNQYCFLSALSNKQNPSDPFPYYTGIGMNLPQVARPTCNGCLKQAMSIFAKWAVRYEQPLAETYLDCAGIVNGVCGSGFADANVKAGSVNDAQGSTQLKNSADTSGAVVGVRGWSRGMVSLTAVVVGVLAALV
ncbi:uncharacterized protein AB675_2806 [Cyphellophora attinorum]|uniref:DUF7729 domain-containing protein n=1 Tax=Cyphellophora attinorum TaxID=1664694 RepID=A0A0N1HG02_9EURO|nr:uncharacterized protein AB675_2806 [Phialophora attinorum]KPI44920.1 hypothetical protein AB675_2806 [Phialophora attinorum]